MISIGDFSMSTAVSAGQGVSGTPSDPSGAKWWDPSTWTQPAGGTLLPPKQTAPTFSLALASATGFRNTSLAATRAALAPAGVVIKRPVSDGTLSPSTAGTPAAGQYERAPRYERDEPQASAGIPTAYLVGGVAAAALAAFLVFRRK